MKSVSNAWKLEQQKQLRKHLNIFGRIFTSKAKPYFTSALSGFRCKEIFSPVIAGTYYIQATNVKMISIPQASGTIVDEQDYLQLQLYDDGNNLVETINFDSEDLGLGGQITLQSYATNVAKIIISRQGSWELEYIDISDTSKSSIIELTEKDIVDLTYKSHISPINKDLPYQELTIKLNGLDYNLDKKTPLTIETYFSQILAGRVKLGCYYYYLTDIQKDERSKITTLTFSDVLTANFNIRDRIGWFQNKRFATHISSALNLINYLGKTANAINYLPEFYQHDGYNVEMIYPTGYSAISDYFWSGYCGAVYKNTIAETLQQIGQSIGCCLSINESNLIRYNSLIKTTTSFNEKMYAIGTLKPAEISEDEKVYKASLLRHIMPSTVSYESAITLFDISNWQFVNNDDGYYQYVDLTDGIYNFVGGSGYDDVYWTSNFVSISSSSSSSTATASVRKLTWTEIPTASIWVANDNGTYNLSIELPLSATLYNGNVDYAKVRLDDYCKYNKRFTTTVRFDPRFECGDYFTLQDGETKYKCLLTDINMTYNGGMQAEISGIVYAQTPKPPVVKNLKFVDSSNFSIEIYNPNDEALTLNIYTSSGESQTDITETYTLLPKQTWIADNGHYQAYGDYLDEISNLSGWNIMTAWFTNSYGENSDTTIVADFQLNEPLVVNVRLTSETIYQIIVKNNSFRFCDLTITDDNTFFKSFSVSPYQEIIFDYSNCPEISPLIAQKLNGTLETPIYVYAIAGQWEESEWVMVVGGKYD